MYEEFWGLKEKPFENTPDPRFLYYTTQHEEALCRLLYVIKEKKGAGILTGVFGCGKTVIAHALLKELEADKYKIAYVNNPQLNSLELLRMMVYYLGLSKPPSKKSDLLMVLNDIFQNNIKDGKETVIIIDEAHTIEDHTVFEELRLLLNFQSEERFLLTLLVIGQPELATNIDNIKQLTQRIAIRCHLDSLSLEDSIKYIQYRLKVAGLEKEIFDQSAYPKVHLHSGGIPRRINRICDLCLLTGFSKNIRQINEEVVEESLKNFGGW